MFKADTADTEVHVYLSTTEDLVKTEKGSVAFNQYPGGAKKAAPSVLWAGRTCCEVTLVKPGDPAGMKFHLILPDRGEVGDARLALALD